jgi:cytochrome c peroxidase
MSDKVPAALWRQVVLFSHPPRLGARCGQRIKGRIHEACLDGEEDRYVFRVAMLRNIAKTAPYFHDGSVDSLDRAVKIMANVQLGRALDDATVSGIVAFLESLTGDVPSHYAPPGEKPSR